MRLPGVMLSRDDDPYSYRGEAYREESVLLCRRTEPPADTPPLLALITVALLFSVVPAPRWAFGAPLRSEATYAFSILPSSPTSEGSRPPPRLCEDDDFPVDELREELEVL